MKKLAILLSLACVALGALAGGGSASPAAGAAPVMTGLHNPRGLAFDNHGSLYVAEAGQGGSAPCAVFSDGMTKCYGPTGRISRLKNGVQAVVADGLPSNAPAGGNGAVGPHNIAVEGGHLFVTDGLGANPLNPEIQPFRDLGQGTLIKVHPNSHWDVVTDISAFEAAHNPVGQPDTQPVWAHQHGRPPCASQTRAGTTCSRSTETTSSCSATFPSRPQRDTDSVPTTVAQGPDGSYYVGELSGAPFNAGAANVYRVAGGQATVYCSGFTAIISIAFGPDGHLYVLQFASAPGLNGPGVLYRIDAGCTKTPVVTDLFTPGGVAFGPDGAAYISQGSILASDGTVWRFELGS